MVGRNIQKGNVSSRTRLPFTLKVSVDERGEHRAQGPSCLQVGWLKVNQQALVAVRDEVLPERRRDQLCYVLLTEQVR